MSKVTKYVLNNGRMEPYNPEWDSHVGLSQYVYAADVDALLSPPGEGLTRDELVETVGKIVIAKSLVEYHALATAIVDNDLAQRATLATLQADLEETTLRRSETVAMCEHLQAELEAARAVIQAVNTEGLTIAVMNAVIERDTLKAELEGVRRERDALKDLSNVTEHDLEAAGKWSIAHADVDAEWRKTATIESALAMYGCAIANWSICLVHNKRLEQQLAAREGELASIKSCEADAAEKAYRRTDPL